MKIKVLEVDDWVAVYLNGEILTENHRVSAQELLELLAEWGLVEYESEWIDDDVLEEWGYSFPRTV